MFEEFFDYLKTPFGLVRFNVDDLKSCFVVDWMCREIAEVANAINGYTQLVRKSFRSVGLVEQKIDFFCQVFRLVAVRMKHVLKAASGERSGGLWANGQYVARLYVIPSDFRRHLWWDRTTVCTDWINLPPFSAYFLNASCFSDFNGDIPALGTSRRPICPITLGRRKKAAISPKSGTLPVVMKMDAAMQAFHNGFCQAGCAQEHTPHSEVKEPLGRDNPPATPEGIGRT